MTSSLNLAPSLHGIRERLEECLAELDRLGLSLAGLHLSMCLDLIEGGADSPSE